MTLQIAVLLIILIIAVVLFSIERLPADIISMGLLFTLAVAGMLPPDEIFAGFGSDTVIMIFGLLILTATLVYTGVVDIAGRALLRFTGKHPHRILLTITTTAATLSAFISNTATTALFIPLTLNLARRTKINASKLLMPLAFASILASSVTLISSSTNIVVNGILEQYNLQPLGMFELTAVGLPIAIVGLLYMAGIGNRMIPIRDTEDSHQEHLEARPYLSEIQLRPNSTLIGKTLAEARLGHDLDLTVLRIARDKNRYLVPQANVQLLAKDKLLVEGHRENLLKFATEHSMHHPQMASKKDMKSQLVATHNQGTNGPAPTTENGNQPAAPPLNPLPEANQTQAEDIQLVEVILLPRSDLIGRTLEGLRFRQRYGLQVLGINRGGKQIYRKLSQVELHTGDQLLIQGGRTTILRLDRQNVFRIISTLDVPRPNRHHAVAAVIIFTGVIALAAVNVLTLPLAVWLGVLLVFITNCISPDAAYHTIEWKALIVVGSMLALGRAMIYTGAAEFLAHQVAMLTAGAAPIWLLTAFFALTMILTQPLSNQAAAVVVLPIALETANQLGLNPRTFAIMIAVGASCSFITPLEPACLMVYGPGQYKFGDFVRVGAFLTIIIYAIAILMIPWVWPM
ncbi:MAG: SLC13 family permease [Anaerolineae bacterium]|nr:SLC13 family permease [Anaerolineae bacterium]